MFELDGPVRPADPRHQSLAMPRLYVWSTGQVRFEHVEIVGHNCIELVILPMRPEFRFVSHCLLLSSIGENKLLYDPVDSDR